MANTNQPEVWLRGPVPGVPALLQPVAHGLLQCREELHAHVRSLGPDALRATPGGAASIGFHVRHAAGSLDRLFTYARGEALSAAQLAALRAESEPDLTSAAARNLLAAFDEGVERALTQLRSTDAGTLLEQRGVGRAQLPSTALGLLFHAAEHTQRHAAQAITTAKVLSRPDSPGTARAAGTFEVKLNPLALNDGTEGTLLGRMSIDKQFHGDFEGTSKGEMLSAGTAVKGSAGYVAIERASGTLGGRTGTFVLQHSGTMTRGEPHLLITVVPDSGTGGLTTLAGTMTITIADGKHSYEMNYTLDAAG